jgi:hypothetical protein
LHPIVSRCPSSFPIPNYFATSLQNPNEYDCNWQLPTQPPSRLVRIIVALSEWTPPTTEVEHTAHPDATPWEPHPVTIDIPSLPKDEASTAHIQLVHDLHSYASNIIIYTDGSQLDGHTGAGYYIPNSQLWEVRAVVPMGTSSEVFDTELPAIDESLKTCLKYIRLYHLRD